MNSEPKKMLALRKELTETNSMLLWLLSRIDRRNDDMVDAPFCPEPDMSCCGNCQSCWFSAAINGVRHEQA